MLKSFLSHHPKGLYVLSFAEFWERFGFYAVQSLLVLFLIQHYKFSQAQSYTIFSTFSALLYISPVIGGMLADKLLGFRRSIMLGAILFFAGYLFLTFPGKYFFYLALALLVCGNGFFKSTVSSLLGELYKSNSIYKESGYTIFYMMINLGAFVSPIVCTYFAFKYSYAAGYSCAAIGMVIAIIACNLCFKSLGRHGLAPKSQKISGKSFQNKIRLVYIGILIAIIVLTFLLQHDKVAHWVFSIFSLGVIGFIIYLLISFRESTRRHVIALCILLLSSIIFWALYMQVFMSLMVFINSNVNRHFWGMAIPAPMYTSIVAGSVIIMSPIFAYIWSYLSKHKINLSIPTKFVLGLVLIGLEFVVISLSIKYNSHAGIITSSWIIFGFFLQTSGELCLSPIGLHAVSTLSPKNYTGMFMGVWFLCLSAGYIVGGYLANLTAIPKSTQNSISSASLYGHNFMLFGLLAIGSGVILAILSPWLKSLINR